MKFFTGSCLDVYEKAFGCHRVFSARGREFWKGQKGAAPPNPDRSPMARGVRMENRYIDPCTGKLKNCAMIKKSRNRYGGLSGMNAAFPVKVNKVVFSSSESLYQACRFPDNHDLQLSLASDPSPVSARILAEKEAARGRPDWEEIKISVMLWVLRVKRVQNPVRMLAIFSDIGDRPIVRLSKRDAFWGAFLTQSGHVDGENLLGRLWMKIREEDPAKPVSPPEAANFLVAGREVGEIPAEAPWAMAI